MIRHDARILEHGNRDAEKLSRGLTPEAERKKKKAIAEIFNADFFAPPPPLLFYLERRPEDLSWPPDLLLLVQGESEGHGED